MAFVNIPFILYKCSGEFALKTSCCCADRVWRRRSIIVRKFYNKIFQPKGKTLYQNTLSKEYHLNILICM